MDVVISESRIDQLIAEDVPYVDLTTELLGMGAKQGRIRFITREDCVLCGTEVALRVLERLGVTPVSWQPSSAQVAAGECFCVAEGPAASLHKAWKVCLNLFDHLSAVATLTRTIVDAAHSANPACPVLTTRKSMPGCKDLLTLAVTAGGAVPHRLGLSETVLVFDNHYLFLGGFEGLLDVLPRVKAECIEKKIFVECDAQQALQLARVGVDGIQFEKLPPEELCAAVQQVRAINPHISLVAAGGINAKNAADYAATGVDGLVTTAPFSAKPLDMTAKMEML
ncbi:MAG: ModD protein [Coriobacteriia bacterium]|nr:ModD protein [Coriobacteriia bacterium]